MVGVLKDIPIETSKSFPAGLTAPARYHEVLTGGVEFQFWLDYR